MFRFRRPQCAAILAMLVIWAGFAIPQSLAQSPAAGTTAFTGARLIDGTGSAPVEPTTIVITDGRIAAVGPAASVAIPAGVTRVDLAGKTILPGIVNAHGHLNVDENTRLPVREHIVERLRAYADYGVTTVMSLGQTVKDETVALQVRADQRQGKAGGARFYTSGQNAIAKDPEGARAAVNRLADLKVDFIKTRLNGRATDMDAETLGAVIDEAHERGLRTAIHIFYLRDAKLAIQNGIDVIAHSVRDQNVDQALIAEMKRHNVAYIPTLTRDLSVFVYESTPDFFQDPFFQRGMYAYKTEFDLLSNPENQEKIRNSPQAQVLKRALAQGKRNLKILADAGVQIAMGTDTGSADDPGRWHGYFEHVEMEMMVESGLTPMQVIVASTSGAAKVLRLDQELGSIEPGKWGDLLVLNADPLANIRNTREIHSVWIAGRKVVEGN
jgi:imidazolonepropionase-like amidohydrolase